MTPEDAKLIIRGQRSAAAYEIAEAAVVILAQLEETQGRARLVRDKASSTEYDDAVLQNIRATCGYILGETKTVRTLGLGR